MFCQKKQKNKKKEKEKEEKRGKGAKERGENVEAEVWEAQSPPPADKKNIQNSLKPSTISNNNNETIAKHVLPVNEKLLNT